jgi:hypothetical protein
MAPTQPEHFVSSNWLRQILGKVILNPCDPPPQLSFTLTTAKILLKILQQASEEAFEWYMFEVAV